MTQEEALKKVTEALAPETLSELQSDIFRRAWNKQSYHKIAWELNHEYSYIKDVGAQLWQLLTQALGIKVTKLNVHEALAQYAQQEEIRDKSTSSRRNRTDWGEAPDISHFCGRVAQLTTLQQWVMQDRCRLVAIAGMGGIGKTMLVTQLAQQLADSEHFEFVVWRSLRQAPPLVDFLSELMGAISPERSPPLQLDTAIRQLLEQLRHHRCLLILDNVEAVLSSSELVGMYRPGYEDYGWLFKLLGEGQHHSSILLTSREIPTEIATQAGATTPTRLLRLEPLSIEEGKAILAAKGLTVQIEQLQLQKLIERYQGNPLTLQIVATPLKELQGHSDRISSVAFSPDGRLLASGSFDRTVRLWDVGSGNFLRAFRTHSWVSSVAFSADGSLLASSGVDRVVRLWDVETGQCLRVIEPGVNWVPTVAFSPKEQYLASGNEDGTVKLWDVSNSQCLLTLEGHARQTRAIAFDPVERRLASGSDDCSVKLWDLQTGRCLQTLEGHTHPVVSISFHPQGNLLVSGGFDRTLKLWDLQQGTHINTLQGHTSPIRSVAFDPEGRLLVSSSEDGTIRLWDSCTGDCLRVLTVERPYEKMNISGVTGLTDAQKETLRVLGAIES